MTKTQMISTHEQDEKRFLEEVSFLPLILKSYPPYHVKSLSYYMWTVQDVYGLGCSVGMNAALVMEAERIFVFLAFGNPYQNSGGILGTKLYDQTFIPIDQISSSVVTFSLGFYNCTPNDTIVIAVGTNSSGGTVTDVIAQRHGEAWANLIIGIQNRYLDYPGLSSRVTAVGANNIEPSFNPAYIPRHWLDGYNSVLDRKRLYVIASADGCPQDYPPTEPELGDYSPGTCNDGWTQEDVYYSITDQHLRDPRKSLLRCHCKRSLRSSLLAYEGIASLLRTLLAMTAIWLRLEAALCYYIGIIIFMALPRDL